MNTNRNEFAHRIGAIMLLLTIVSFCIVGTSFASLSATYRWKSNETGVGDFDFFDKEFGLNLFGSDTIMPGDFGGSSLEGTSVGRDVKVGSWRFSENNEDRIPVVFYILNDDSTVRCAYSSYSFIKYITQYVKLVDSSGRTGYCPVTQISSDQTDFIAGLTIGAEIRWIWPDALFDKKGEEYVNTAVDITEYTEYNAELCKSRYAFNDDTLNILSNDMNGADKFGIIAYAAKGNENRYEDIKFVNNGQDVYTLENGKVLRNGTLLPFVHAGNFTDLFASEVSVGDYLCCFVSYTHKDALITYMTANNIPSGVCEVCGNYNQATWIPDGNGDRILVKLYPSKLDDKAKLSVTITATIESV